MIFLAHLNAIAEVAATNVERGIVETRHRTRDGSRQHDSDCQSHDFEQEKNDSDRFEDEDERRAERTHRSQKVSVDLRDPQREVGEHRQVFHVRTQIRTDGLERGESIDVQIERVSGWRKRALVAGNLLAENVMRAVERDSPGRRVRRRLEQPEADGAELRWQAIEHGGRDRSDGEQGRMATRNCDAFGRRKPELIAELSQAGELLAVCLTYDLLAVIQNDKQARRFALGRGDNFGDFRAQKDRVDDRGRIRRNRLVRLQVRFASERRGNRIRIGGDHFASALEIVSQEVCADLQLEEICRDEHHREKKHNGRDTHEEIGDDQAIPQRPHSLGADKQNQPHEKISGGGDTNKDDQRSEREGAAGYAVNREHQSAQDEDHRSDTVELRHVPEPYG